MPVAAPRIIVALDFANLPQALACADLLDPRLCRVKVGKELFTRAGPAVINGLHERGFSVFLDLKYHDIPNTVAKAVLAACEQGVWLVNVHALGGTRMMQAALASVQQAQSTTQIIGVTVLTSFDAIQLAEIGLSGTIADNVHRLAQLTKQAGLHGVVCSAQEARQIKAWCGADFLTVTPGIRPPGSQANDQERIMTPGQAVQNGADYLVIGRPITDAADPLVALQQCQQEIINCIK